MSGYMQARRVCAVGAALVVCWKSLCLRLACRSRATCDQERGFSTAGRGAVAEVSSVTASLSGALGTHLLVPPSMGHWAEAQSRAVEVL